MLINLSNHSSKNWSKKQLSEAEFKFKEIIDIAFPAISPNLNEIQVTDLVQKYVKNILEVKPQAVHIMGEMNFTYKCVNLLKLHGISCFASTTERNVIERDNEKIAIFEFVQFREY